MNRMMNKVVRVQGKWSVIKDGSINVSSSFNSYNEAATNAENVANYITVSEYFKRERMKKEKEYQNQNQNQEDI